MVVGFIFKRVIPSMVIYYGAMQAYLGYHMFTTPSTLQKPMSSLIKPNEARKKLVQGVKDVYKGNAKPETFQNWSKDFEFEDMFTYMEGIGPITNTGYLIKEFDPVVIDYKSEVHYEDGFRLEMTHNYTAFKRFTFTLPTVIYAKTERDKLVAIRDEFFGKSLITEGNAPFMFIGKMSRVIRTVQGKLFNLRTTQNP
ncbi:predicted protein [Nematostella vectensis]|uniref:Uncharacterized protein n=1 Tax=Nematostella vectensis TaxID=45351 RepID=A7S8K3_NEMVE|nr:predicted protein [Nematostella vectensis]|eukprot:XP_001632016.1 predicted protein [Nematostella vectensis]